ncbi:uncharacterized protein A1O9_08359 [Exophiala aquamarina CBS 119918]|uniref:Glucose-methanol-choline oxidoreductase N-terminal domain-containing protein n=1 Tax=Exophiala aquamarina CBS 119918 TaxID=1182545 RepID=A0A072P662_9EURO|nr:uncharacterized protein A1O9_08359 [Exophiala aquamarina CBS 119918]KEF55609.1 hypothetical protein A1O9_08359 [Exophiala aquamarina CBS 119918]
MGIITSLAEDDVSKFDYVIVGGGTAGCIVASRLSGYLPQKRIIVIEGGPSDIGDDRALILKERVSTQGTELDMRYKTTEQPKGGCSSHNDMVSFRLPEYDTRIWEKLGAKGWTFDTFNRLHDRIRASTYPAAHPRDRNQLTKDWISSAHDALGLPYILDLNDDISGSEGLRPSVGWTPLSYNPDNGYRSSASVAYIHPILRGEEKRPNLTILTSAWVSHLNIIGDAAISVDVTTNDGERLTIPASTEIILCAGSIDTPRLLLLSGLGPRQDLEDLRIQITKDIPGVGQNLQDHPATVVVYDLHDKAPSQTATHSDGLAFLRHKPENWAGDDGNIPDILLHMWALEFSDDTSRVGYARPDNPFCVLPAILRPQTQGKLYLKSDNPTDPPALDFKYFEDPEGYDAELLVAGIKAIRKLAQTEPLKRWIKREVAPGPDIVSDYDLDVYARKVGASIYHPACTTKMGDLEADPLAVVDSKLKVRGMKNLRIADAGIFPTMISVNLMLTVMAVGERAAELIAEDAGWSGLSA